MRVTSDRSFTEQSPSVHRAPEQTGYGPEVVGGTYSSEARCAWALDVCGSTSRSRWRRWRTGPTAWPSSFTCTTPPTHQAWVAAAAAARYLPGIVTSVFAVRILERFPPRKLLVLSDICCAIAIAAIGIRDACQGRRQPSRSRSQLVVRVAASGQAPAAALLLPIVAGGGDLSRVASRQATTDKLLLLAGPAVGGLLLIVISPAVEMLVLAALVAVAAVVSLGLPSPGQLRPLPADPARR